LITLKHIAVLKYETAFFAFKTTSIFRLLFSQNVSSTTQNQRMKKIALLTLSIFLLSETFAINDKIRLGFVASPGMGWFAPKGNDLKKGTVQFAMNYGVVVDYYFKDQNYGIQSGCLAASIKDNCRTD
jgi:hypothetical protein